MKKGEAYAEVVSGLSCHFPYRRGVGYGGIASDAAEIAKILFFIFLGLWAVTLILALIAGQKLFGQRR